MDATYTRGYRAHAFGGDIGRLHVVVMLPDEVAVDQASFDGATIPVRHMNGTTQDAVLRGDLYGLGTPGTGDPVVELIES